MHRKSLEKRYEELALKRLNGTITPGEAEELANWLSQDDGRPLEVPPAFARDREALEQRIWSQIQGQTRPKLRYLSRRMWMAAASVLLLAGLLMFAYWWSPQVQPEVSPKALPCAETKPAEYIKHITLPDGSNVVLHAHSSLEYYAAADQRKVVLSGEAYFDIVKNELPFVIHTGDVRTTVLGTALNIKAYPGQSEIVVSVTRGKVKVEADRKLLAELTTDQQIRYFAPKKQAVQEMVAAETIVTDWTKQDMIFEDMPFIKVAEMLKRRYDVDIRFTSPAVGNCPVRASFNGTEPVERVIKILCNVLGDQYTLIDKATYLISGESCH